MRKTKMMVAMAFACCLILIGCGHKENDGDIKIEDPDKEVVENIQEESKEQEKTKVLSQHTYSIGNDTFDFSFGQEGDGSHSLTLICHIEDKSDVFETHVSLNAIFNSDEESLKFLTEDANFSYIIFAGDGTTIARGKNSLLATKDGKIIDVKDYFSDDWLFGDERKESDYGTQVVKFLADFMENY